MTGGVGGVTGGVGVIGVSGFIIVGGGVGVGVTGVSGLHSFPTFLYPVLHVLTSQVPQVFVVVFHTCSPLPLAMVQGFLLFIQEFPSLWNSGLQFCTSHDSHHLVVSLYCCTPFPL